MGNLLPLLVAAVLATLAIEPLGEVRASVPGILAFLAAWYAAGRGLADHHAAAALAPGADPRYALGRFRRVVGLHRMLVLPSHALVLWIGGWAAVARDARVGGGDFAGLAVAILPYFVLGVLSRAATHPAEARLGFDRLPLLRSLLQGARLGALVVVPLALVLTLLGGGAFLADLQVSPFRELGDLAARWDFVAGGFALAALAAVLLVFPVIAMAILGARPMPDGPLRRRLEAYAARVGLRSRNLYVWPTDGAIPNAAVMGVGRRLRCVVFTDALLDQLDEEEVEAVFAHEAGHAVHGHLPFFFVFTIAYSLGIFGLERFLPAGVVATLDGSPLLQYGLVLGGLLVYFGLLFGFVSRRLEQQADVHGLLTVGLPEGEDPARVLREPERHPFLRSVAEGGAAPGEHPFVRSLDRIASIMGGVRELTGWRHFSIADRVDFLERFVREEPVRRRYRGRLRALLGILGLVFLLFAAAAATDLPVQAAGPRPAAALDRAGAALRRGRVAEARRWLEEGLRGAEARRLLLSASGARLLPGRPILDLSIHRLAQEAEAPGVPPAVRFRLRQTEAILRSLRGDAAAAVACAEGALGSKAPPEVRAGHLALVADLLGRAGRPHAAAVARADAAAAAREARDQALILEIEGGG
jgi:STE24 endopeptidase